MPYRSVISRGELRAPVVVRGMETENGRWVQGAHQQPDREGYPSLTLLSPAPPLQRGHRSFALDGAGIVDGVVVRGNEDLDQVLPTGAGGELSLADLASWWADNSSNPCALFVVDDRTQEALVLPDPLGGALTWHYEDARINALSSDNVSLARVVHAVGGSVTTSIDFQLQRVLFGNGGYQVASHREFTTLPALHYWHLKHQHVRTRRYTSLDLRFDLPYADQLHILRDELVDHVTALAQAPAQVHIAHLTAGFDSRLVLAAALAAGVTDRFAFVCSGPDGTHDRLGADGLTQVYGLRRCSDGGLKPMTLSTHVERVMAPNIHSGGLTGTGPTGLESPWDALVLGGGYGGVMRGVYSKNTADLPAEADPDELLRRFAARAQDQSSFLVPTAQARLADQLASAWRDSASAPVPQDFIGDRLYTDVRSRYHFGQTSMLWSRVGARFDPLYSVSALAVSQDLPVKARATNVVGMDLMDMLVPGLSGYPFDHDRFSDDFMQMRRRPQRREFPTWREPHLESSGCPWAGQIGTFPALAGSTGGTPSPPASGDEQNRLVQEANRLGVHYWQLATLSEARSALSSSLEQLDHTDLEDSIDLQYVKNLVTTDVRTRPQIRHVHALLGVLGWQSSEHDRTLGETHSGSGSPVVPTG